MNAILLPLLLAAAASPQDKLPPANPLPPPSSEEGQVMAPVVALLAGFETGDGAAITRQVRADGGISTVGAGPFGPPGVARSSWADFARGIAPSRAFQVRLSSPAIDIDGDIAMVWAPYVVRIGGKVTNCGMSHFDLIRDAGAWKVLNLTNSSRTTDCGQ